jgi:hydroxyacylglutathione hydrolase
MNFTSFSIQQFEDKSLSHYSYAVTSQNETILIDPARNPQPYYDFAKKNHAKIVGVIETHPHADFVSSHLEIHQTLGAVIYTSKLVGAEYPHKTFDDGDFIKLGNVILKAINTPGHSPDSICIVLEVDGKDKVVFTGDTLFIGDCGRPDLRENAGNLKASRESLAKNMYHSLRNKVLTLANEVIVYPAHGAGTLCGKGLSNAKSSTIGAEKISNWSLQKMNETDFIKILINDQPFMPKYFGFDVALNKKGADNFRLSIAQVEKFTSENYVNMQLNDVLIIDTRTPSQFRDGHLENCFNIPVGLKFETWLGSIVQPNEMFYLFAETENELEELIERIAKIGYEMQIKGAFADFISSLKNDILNLEHFITHKNEYTIIDIRNTPEVKEKKIFENSINIPLTELRGRINEIPTNKPILVHCAGGYRSAIGSSIIKNYFADKVVYDLSEAVSSF